MADRVDIVVMSNQSATTFVNLDNPAREITRAPGASPPPATPIKRRPGRPKKEASNG